MQRRSTAVSGYVNFPVTDPAWRNSKEGGMVVKLVVCDDRDFDAQFGMCCGAQVYDVLGESLLSDDRRPYPAARENYARPEDVVAEQKEIAAWQAYHFPHADEANAEGADRYLSRPYLAAIVLGTTGWSGWHTSEDRAWSCTFADLSPDGQALYRLLAQLYPGCTLHLLTYLDT